ncbi:MAG: xanthine dehydrogenase family protein subunit M [Holophagales bacterium]|nr:xanthine dehydrogenase family protein subunit M [Holophagales bacterium]
MYPSSFEYLRAESVDHALGLLGEHGDAKLLAGGHSLLPMLKLRLAEPGVVVDIGRITELRGVSEGEGELSIGSLTTHHEVATSELVAARAPVLAEAAAQIGDPQVRNRGTVGGNIAHADPASDLPAVLVALGATVHLRSRGGDRAVPAADFFVGLLTTDLQNGELLTSVSVPVLDGGDGSAYLKHEHPASGYAISGAAAVIRDGAASLAFNGITATPLDAAAVGAALAGGDLSDAAIDAAIDAHLEVSEPLSDVQASGPYRTHLAKVYGKRALRTARDRR